MAMAALGVTTRQVAVGAHVSYSTLIRMRQGKVASRGDTLDRVERWLNTKGVWCRTDYKGFMWVGADPECQQAKSVSS